MIQEIFTNGWNHYGIGSKNFSVLQNLPGNLFKKKKIVGLHPQYLWFSTFKVWPYGQEHTFLTSFQVMLLLVWGPHCESLCINEILVGNQKMGKAGCHHFNLFVKLSKTQPDIVSLQVLCKLKYIVLNYTGRVL